MLPRAIHSEPESAYAWVRLAVAVVVGTLGCVGMWSVIVVLPSVQTEFGVSRGGASMPYAATMAGLALGAVVNGRLADRFGIIAPLVLGTIAMSLGYVASGFAPTIWWFGATHVLIGLGSSAAFAPLMADLSQWFTRNRGIAVAICSSGNYLAGTVWPPIIQTFIASEGWRPTQIGIGLLALVAILPLLLFLRRRVADVQMSATGSARPAEPDTAERLGLSPTTLQILLCVAGVACCVAMATPQVHIVAYCGDLGYGAAVGAQMLSLMLGLGIVSRILAGYIADKIGGVMALLIGSVLQGVAIVFFLFFDSLPSLYMISALFGLFQGGIVPMYAVVVREYFPAREAATRIGLIIMMTLFGMALGGWMAGAIYDLTGSYAYAFANGIVWNVLNAAIMVFLLARDRRRNPVLRAAPA